MTMPSAFFLVFALSVMTEGVVEYLGQRLPTAFKPYTAAAVAVAVCVAYNADLLAILGYTALYPGVGAVLTGLVIGRGSNYLADLVKRLQVVSVPSAPIDAIIPDHSTPQPSRSAAGAAAQQTDNTPPAPTLSQTMPAAAALDQPRATVQLEGLAIPDERGRL